MSGTPPGRQETPLGPQHSRFGVEARVSALEDQVRELRRMVWLLSLMAGGGGAVAGAALSQLVGGG